jgi:hypothetical protein
MSGWVRFTSRSICSIISEYCYIKQKFQTASVITNKKSNKGGQISSHMQRTQQHMCRYTLHACTLNRKLFFSETKWQNKLWNSWLKDFLHHIIFL